MKNVRMGDISLLRKPIEENSDKFE